MRQYGGPQKLIRMVKTLSEDCQCSVIDETETTDWFPVMAGVKQGCCISGFLFLLVIDWVMRKNRRGRENRDLMELYDRVAGPGLRGGPRPPILRNKPPSEQTTKLEDNAAKVGLKPNAKNCKAMKANNKNDDKLKVRGSEVEEVETLTYLGANRTKDGGGTADVKKRVALASSQMKRLSNIW
ncbi:uncharacterized protein LOC111322699 [Stylophora pistillata]|uniref:uncharacterized protein LOC111322699 n=1 Tax=Stylophora pistillata TaxID=50429 RepID=UPI000C03A48F|nr:uncharacterized protein LOC111322699 [Stylophora pistillata]